MFIFFKNLRVSLVLLLAVVLTIVQTSYSTDMRRYKYEMEGVNLSGVMAKIIGSESVLESMFLKNYLFMARISQLNSNGYYIHVCGASFISENWLITTAHCFTTANATDIKVRLNPSKYRIHYGTKDCKLDKMAKIDKIIIHPYFSYHKFQNDIALIRLTNGLETKKSNITRAYLNIEDDIVPNQKMIILGYADCWYGHLRYASMTVKNHQECKNMYSEKKIVITDKHFCFNIDEASVEDGDSGSPALMIDNKNQTVLAGLLSFQYSELPAVYVNVRRYLNWIKRIILDNKPCQRFDILHWEFAFAKKFKEALINTNLLGYNDDDDYIDEDQLEYISQEPQTLNLYERN